MKTKISLLMLFFSIAFTEANAQRLHFDTTTVTNSTSCSACNGAAIVHLLGGFTPYTYSWSNGNTNSSASNLCAGNYTVFGYDSHGDSAETFFIVGGPAALTNSMSSTNTTCSGNTGTARINVSGGTTPYTYLWSDGATTSSISALSAGTYSVSVNDLGGCSTSGSITIVGGLSLGISHVNVSCSGGNNATATVTSVSGGVSPYTYLWSPGGGTTSSISALSAGVYFVEVTDNNGCTGIDSVYISQPYPLMIDSAIVITGSNCSGNNGSASVSIIGGTMPYTYLWAPTGGTKANASNLSAGTYTINITDKNGCTVSASVIVPLLGPTPHVSTINDSCYGQSNGIATVTSVSGGVSPYTYLWMPSSSTNNSISGLSAGTYTLTVTDHSGCTGTTAVYISQPSQLMAVIDTVADTGSCSGAALIFPSGGTGPYTYTWSNHVTNSVDSGYDVADSLCAGAYFVCITDSHGCSTCDSVHIRHALRHVSGIANIYNNAGDIKIYPVPVSSTLQVQLGSIGAGNYNLTVYDMIGREVIHLNNMAITEGKTSAVDISQIPPGEYMLRIYGDNLNKTAPFIVVH